MSDLYQPSQMIDTHQHLWKPSERRYDWLDAAGLPLNADFGPEDVEADVAAAGITGTVLVQAADTYEDTFYMLSVAARVPVVRGVVAWAPLDRADEADGGARPLRRPRPWFAASGCSTTTTQILGGCCGPRSMPAWPCWLRAASPSTSSACCQST